jgi:hypothetical protein
MRCVGPERASDISLGVVVGSAGTQNFQLTSALLADAEPASTVQAVREVHENGHFLKAAPTRGRVPDAHFAHRARVSVPDP